MRRPFVRGTWLAACLALGGCTILPPSTVRIESVAGMYQRVSINYRVDGGQLSEPLTVARISGQKVTQERLPSSPYPDHSLARLSIRYPHPDGKAGYALGELVIESRTPPNAEAQAKKAFWQQWVDAAASTARDIIPGVKPADGVYEAWAMDIAKGDLDRVIAGLSQSGYFVNPSKTAVGVELAARLDSFEAHKHWTREPELDNLMQRVQREGRLVSYERPVDSRGRGAALAAGPSANRVVLVSHEQEGPALAPAGPQNNVYLNPPGPTRPARSQQYTPPALPYTPPVASYAPEVDSLPAPATPAPARQSPRKPKTVQPPRSAPPATASSPAGKPRNRWQYPPQYRRAAPKPSQETANSAAAQAVPNGSRVFPQQRLPRMPWQKPRVTAGGQPTADPASPGPANNPDPRRPRLPRYGAQQPPPGGRTPPRLQRPRVNPTSPSGPYSAQPPSDTSQTSGGYPAGLPQPPQISSRPSGY